MPDSERARVEIVSSHGALEALAPEWDRVAGATEIPMLSHAWVLSCARTLHAADALHIVTVYQDGQLAGAAPLVATTHAGIRRLELIGAATLYEPSGLLYASDDVRDRLLRPMLDAGSPMLLSRIPGGASLAARLSALGRGVAASRRAASSLAVPIASTWNEYLGQLSSRRRYDLRRARRRTEDAGRVGIRILSPGPDDVDEMFADFVRLEAAGWKARNGSSLSQRHDLRAFFLHYAKLASGTGRVRFSFLDVNGSPVAAQLSVEHAERLWVLKIGYDEQWSRCSPGWQLLAETMKYAFEQKLRAYEFLGCDESWLHGWETESRELESVTWYPASVPGLLGLAGDIAGRVRSKAASLSKRMHE